MTKHRNIHLHPRRRGYVLLLTLVLLALAALALQAVSRAALRRIVDAGEAQTELQRRWGTISCRQAILPVAAKLLDRAQRDPNQPVTVLHRSVSLGDQTFDLTLCDESAKANVKTLIARQGKQQAELTLRRLALASPDLAAHVHLRWPKDKLGPQSFGEVFDIAKPSDLCDGSAGSSAQRLTCWGDGRVNIHRADEQVLREICNGVLDLNQIQKLLDMRQLKVQPSLAKALDSLQLPAGKRQLAETILSDSSTCYSLWTRCQSTRRTDYSLAIVDQGKPIWQWNWYEW